ncbi:MAG: response regulator transcription factor [Anaerolineae bacterium]|nr:response regulator transcription factor [Anaerolineae bacterium]
MARAPAYKEESIRVLIVDDHAIVRKGIRALLATEAGIQVVGEAYDGQTAISEMQRLRPNVVIMDLVMPGMDGLEAIQRISALKTETHILVLTSFSGVDKIFPAIRAGALGYLLKDSGPEELIRAIRQVSKGNSALHPAIARQLLHELCEPSVEAIPEDPLTDREKEVLRLVAQGEQNQDIADRLSISEATVRTHVSHILTKLELSSRTQAALYALRTGLASLEDVQVVI